MDFNRKFKRFRLNFVKLYINLYNQHSVILSIAWFYYNRCPNYSRLFLKLNLFLINMRQKSKKKKTIFKGNYKNMNNIWLLLLKSFYDKIINTNEEDSKQF